MDEERTVKLYARFKRYALSRNAFTETAEDFASWAIIYYLEHGGYNPAWLWVDYVRQALGRIGKPGFAAKHALNSALSIDLEARPIELVAEEKDDTSRAEVWQVINTLSGRDRDIAYLYGLEGWSEKQVGRALGLTESRVSQIISSFQKKLRRNARGEIIRVTPSQGLSRQLPRQTT